MFNKRVDSSYFSLAKGEDDIHDSNVISSPGSSYRSEDEEWTIIDPKTDRKFIDDVRKKILQCVSNKTDSTNFAEDNKIEDENNIRALDDEIQFREAQIKALNDEMENLRVECGINGNHLDCEQHKSISTDKNHTDEDNDTDDDEEYPTRKDITNYIRDAKIFEDDIHQSSLFGIVKSYVKNVKKISVMKILDNYLTGDEDSDDAEDAIFLISEVLSKK